MITKLLSRKGSIVAAALALSMSIAGVAAAQVFSPGYVYPAGSQLILTPIPTNYPSLAASFWQYLVAIPAAVNPLADSTGVHCTQGQPTNSNIFWLVGAPDNNPVTRSCTVPSGKLIVFPVINGINATFDGDPKQTEAQLRAGLDLQDATNLSVTIDGKAVSNVKAYYEQSKTFTASAPANNLFQAAPFHINLGVDAGYYVAIQAFGPGKHTIKFHGQLGTGASASVQDVTYNLTVK